MFGAGAVSAQHNGQHCGNCPHHQQHATQPVYFDLMPWADGKEHTLTVAIPQGKPVEGMFSHWAVSGALIEEY